MTPGKTTVQIFGLFGLLAAAISVGFTAADVAAADVSAEVQEVSAEVMAAGEGVYSEHCAACHMATGQGDGGTAPPLAGSSRLRDERLVIGQILSGGEYMPSFSFQLSDAEIAAVATYIRNSWENKHGPISEEQVAEMRL